MWDRNDYSWLSLFRAKVSFIIKTRKITSLEVDEEVLELAKKSLSELYDGEIDYIEFRLQNVFEWEEKEGEAERFDICVMNPPFGTKIEHADIRFLEKAFKFVNGPVYSFHKSSTKQVFILCNSETREICRRKQ